MFWLIKKMFIGLLTGMVSNQKCTTQPTIINLHSNKYIQGLYYYPFLVDLDRSVGS